MTTHPDGLAPVRLLRFPVDVWARSNEHWESLRREFALIALHRDNSDVPRRLLELVAALVGEYQEAVADAVRLRDQAHARGEKEVPELVYRVPRQAGAAATRTLARMLDEADEFCRQGQHLLTLTTPPEALAFRRWYLGEFTAQLQGLPPLPWPEADHQRLVSSPLLRGEEPAEPDPGTYPDLD